VLSPSPEDLKSNSESWHSSPRLRPSPVGSSPSPQNKDSSPTRVHCRTRVLHHWQ